MQFGPLRRIVGQTYCYAIQVYEQFIASQKERDSDDVPGLRWNRRGLFIVDWAIGSLYAGIGLAVGARTGRWYGIRA
jgi:hypothetical protein